MASGTASTPKRGPGTPGFVPVEFDESEQDATRVMRVTMPLFMWRWIDCLALRKEAETGRPPNRSSVVREAVRDRYRALFPSDG